MSDWNLTKNQTLARKAERAFERAQPAEMGIAAEAQRSRDLTVRPVGRPSSPSLVQILVARFRLWLTRAPHRPGWQMTGTDDQIVVLGEIEDSKFTGLTIYWYREWKADAVVWVDVAEVDASWKLDRSDYIGPGGQAKPAIAGRYERVGERVLSGQQIWMPHICLDEQGNVSFSDGWHRFAWMRDHRVKAMPIVTDPGDAALIARRFGSRLEASPRARTAPLQIGTGKPFQHSGVPRQVGGNA